MKPLVFALSLGLFFASCSKKDDKTATTNNNSTTTPTDGWKLGSTSYKTVFAAKIGDGTLSAMDGIPAGSNPQVNTFNVWFKTFPTADGTYKVVSLSTTLGANDVYISAGLYSTSLTYYSTGNDNINATVTVSGGKIKVVLPETWVKNTKDAGDSLKITGTLQGM